MLLGPGGLAGADNTPTVTFNRDVRPILTRHCFICHGLDAHKRKAGLRLDTPAGATALLKSGHHAIVPGDEMTSELVRRITAGDPEDRMPPAEEHSDLTVAEISLLRRWVRQGGRYETHWAYAPLDQPAPPDVHHKDAVVNAIDRYVLAGLEQSGIEPAGLADRRTLIRRLSLDLTGLPPQPRLVSAFVHDPRPDAYERLVDHLLDSPHYGERMAEYWLDLVRYADSVGYHGDQDITVWPYRDYVIHAFNDNMPFDRFTRENLAGDLLPHPTRAQRIAATYNRLGMMTAEGGAQAKDYLARYAADRVRTTAETWLAATMGCAQCHDHKFDPYTMKDFYCFAAFFADIKERGVYTSTYSQGVWGDMMLLPTETQATELSRLKRSIAETHTQLNTPTPDLAASQARWEKRIAQPTRWSVLHVEQAVSEHGATIQPLDDGSWLVSGPSPDMDTYTFTVRTTMRDISAFRLELLPHDSLPRHGPGRASNGNLVLNRFTVTADGSPLNITDASATHSQRDYHVEHALVDNGKYGWAILPKTGQRLAAVFETSSKIGDGEPVELVFTLRQTYGYQHTIGRLRLSATSAPGPLRVEAEPDEDIAAIVRTPPGERTEAQRTRLAAYYRSIAPGLAPVRDRLRELEQAKQALTAKIEKMPKTVATKPRVMRILPRGNWMNETGPIVEPAIPEVFGRLNHPGRRATRLDLAHWLTAPDNALTARTFSNRIWYLLFGQGLSPRLDDLGSQGTAPIYPALLDYLAYRFIHSGWDVKGLVKLIVMSRTYRRSSKPTATMREKDPLNRHLARQGRFRLDAEAVRDHALAVSGLLDQSIGGRSVRPYQPQGYYAQLNYPIRKYQADTGRQQYRRGVYMHWQRTFLHPMLKAFDAPSREECTAERPRSNTPLAALTLLNDPTFVESARAFAQRIMTEAEGDVATRLDWAFEQTLSRPPHADVKAVLIEIYRKHLAQYRNDPEAAEKLLNVGLSPHPAQLGRAELAAWTSVARVLFNLHEVVTRY